MIKFCKKCQAETERNKAGYCKLCANVYAATYRAAHREEDRARAAEWYAANLEKAKAYTAANSEKIKARSAAWRKANLEKVQIKKKASDAAWRKANHGYDAARRAANPEIFRIYTNNRNARKRENGGTLSKGLSQKLFKIQRGKCACCSLPLGNDYHLDHIMPIALGGPNVDSNIQLLRQRCNNQKHSKHPVDFMQSRGFLL